MLTSCRPTHHITSLHLTILMPLTRVDVLLEPHVRTTIDNVVHSRCSYYRCRCADAFFHPRSFHLPTHFSEIGVNHHHLPLPTAPVICPARFIELSPLHIQFVLTWSHFLHSRSYIPNSRCSTLCLRGIFKDMIAQTYYRPLYL